MKRFVFALVALASLAFAEMSNADTRLFVGGPRANVVVRNNAFGARVFVRAAPVPVVVRNRSAVVVRNRSFLGNRTVVRVRG